MNVSDSSYVLPASLQPHNCRYVEDTFTCFTHCQMLTNPKNSCHLKCRHSNNRLTGEYPKLKTLPFLDCDVTINLDNLSTSIYRREKKTFTGPGTNYNSFINSSFINNYVTMLNFLTNNGNPHTFLITLSINFYTLYFHRK